MLWPSINPDGQNIVANWYMRNVGTPFETAPLTELYQKYIGHDNNRDAYMLNMVESREIARTWRHWEPQIIYVHHQSSPFPTRIWLPPFAEPIAPRVPALMSRDGEHDRHGHRAQPRGARPGRRDAHGHRLRRLVSRLHRLHADAPEHQLVLDRDGALPLRDAAPVHARRLSRAHYRDLRSESLYPSPWPPGWWRLKDAVDYMLTASMSVLDYAAKYKEELLYNRYQAGRDQIRRYEQNPPYAYVIPQQQRDPVAPVELLRRLAFNGVARQPADRARPRSTARPIPPARGSSR